MKTVFFAILLVLSSHETLALEQPLLDKYWQTCAACHEAGAAGAPITGDTAAWEPLIAKGIDVLVQSVVNGLNAMPPMELCSDCTEADYQTVILYMANVMSGGPKKVDPALIYLVLKRPWTEDDQEPPVFECPAPAEYLPVVKVAPVYPRRAQTRGIEGYCIVEFTVTKTGSVIEPVAVDCQPVGVFESASVKAILKFEYKPCVIDGEPADVPEVRNKFTYELEG